MRRGTCQTKINIPTIKILLWLGANLTARLGLIAKTIVEGKNELFLEKVAFVFQGWYYQEPVHHVAMRLQLAARVSERSAYTNRQIVSSPVGEATP